MTKNTFLSIILLVICLSGQAQNTGHYYWLTGGYGSMDPHHVELEPLKSRYIITDFRWGLQTNGDQFWEQAYGLPTYGFGLSYGSFNNEYLGKVGSLYTFLDFPIVRRNRVSFRSDFAAGLAYFNNPYDEIKNPANRAVSSKILVKLSVGGQVSYQLTKDWGFNLWAGLDHYSNGSTTKPNAGLNSLLIKAGVSYSLNDQIKMKEMVEPPKMDLYSVIFYGATAFYQTNEFSQTYQAANLQVSYNYRLSYKNKLGLGLDYCYNPSVNNGVADFWERGESALVLSHELALHRVSLLTQFCYNIWNDHGRPSYERIALRYWLNDHFFGSAGLKTRWASSIFVEVGLGYSLGWGKVNPRQNIK